MWRAVDFRAAARQVLAKDFAHEHNTKAPEGAVAGISTGAAIGGAAVAVPGVLIM